MENVLCLSNRHTGETLYMRRLRDADGKVYLELNGSLPPGSAGPPPHIHFLEHEEGVVIAGTLAANVGGKTTHIPTGGTAVLPRGVVHNWWNGGDVLLEFRGKVVPLVDFDRYLQAIFAVINASPAGQPSIFYMAHVLWRHRATQQLANPPHAVQRVVFPLVLLVGRLLGKYSGDEWPGSPASCSGAPERS